MRICRMTFLIWVLATTQASAEKGPKTEPHHAVLGAKTIYNPIGFKATFGIQSRFENIDGFLLDQNKTEFAHDPAINTQLRVGLRYKSSKDLRPLFIDAVYEHDLYSGVIYGGNSTDGTLFGPNSQSYDDHILRQAYIQASAGHYFTLGAGFMVSHWGMGLLANDGAHGWTPGSARFIDPRGGDRVLRLVAATGPHIRNFVLFTSIDSVQHDDTTLKGDTASQFVLGCRAGTRKPYQMGLYAVQRTQETADGKRTRVIAADLHAYYHFDLGSTQRLSIETELAAINGYTDLGATADIVRHDVLQLGGALRAKYDTGMGGAGITILYASGDQNPDDNQQNAFKTDQNFDMGFLLFRYVLAAQTARSAVTAADPELGGRPPEDLDRVPTRGSATNTWSFMPHAWFRPLDGLEFYGGVLLALTEVATVDPLNTKLAGGSPRNALNNDPGAYYGTEFDLGLRYSPILWGTALELGLEGAILIPGSALGLQDSILGGRAMAAFKF